MATASSPVRAPGILGGSSWRIARVAGIDIAIDQSWVLIFVLISLSVSTQLAASHADAELAARWATAFVVACAFFASIVLHELGHSLVAQSLGIRVRSITLFLFGGVAMLESEPKKPLHEVGVALAGPAVSVSLAGLFSVLAGGVGEATLAGAGLGWLARVNLALGVFNLAPGFPLDGGRVLRGVLWAATGSFGGPAGAGIALLLMAAGAAVALGARDLIGGLWLVFLGWFLWSASRNAVGAMEVERILGSVSVRDVLEPVRHASVSPSATVAELVSTHVLRSGLRTLWVVDPASERLLGIATLRELARLPHEARETTRIESLMLPVARATSVAPRDTALVGMQRLAAAGVNQLPVLEDGRLVGALTRERLLGLLQAGLWLGEARAPDAPGATAR
ncbi:MAG: site-2 protease family protein [Myxococcota bacterium]